MISDLSDRCSEKSTLRSISCMQCNKECVLNHTKCLESRFHAVFWVIRVQVFCMNISQNLAPAFPAWCATLEKLRIDYGLNCKKRLKRAVFCNHTPKVCEQVVITTCSADNK